MGRTPLQHSQQDRGCTSGGEGSHRMFPTAWRLGEVDTPGGAYQLRNHSASEASPHAGAVEYLQAISGWTKPSAEVILE